jgi:hypothetical protein
MIEIVVSLILTVQGNILEHTYKEKLSDCLKSKRIAEREVNPERIKFICKKVKSFVFEFRRPINGTTLVSGSYSSIK